MTRSGPPSRSLDAAVALTRFGLGAKPGEIDAVAADPRGWLEAQARPDGAAIPEGRFETPNNGWKAISPIWPRRRRSGGRGARPNLSPR